MMQALRRYLIAGLLIWVPLGVTLLIIKLLVDTMDQTLLLLPEHLRPAALLGVHIPGLGIVLAAFVIIGTGVIVANLFGKQMLDWGETLLGRIPLVRTIYGSVKKLTETLFSGSGKSFRKVVLVEYPRKGMWSFAFQTGPGVQELERLTGKQMVNVFIPTTPNPTSGFVLVVPLEEVIELDMSVDEGLKLILSIGVVTPDNKRADAIV
ncbi:MAG: DUF502 domain-containing protein [Gammaproteobacteria bacterium]|nr:DUF502 domain-containing protein [Gammaproteobacteria bacterium]